MGVMAGQGSQAGPDVSGPHTQVNVGFRKHSEGTGIFFLSFFFPRRLGKSQESRILPIMLPIMLDLPGLDL